jgi:putative endonuclease
LPPFGLSRRQSVGLAKERLACTFLERHGLRLVASNYRCRRGEIDLVMRDDAVLVFVEVRYRASDAYGTAAESVGARKQRRLVAAAGHYLQRHRVDAACRFDVLSVGAGDRIDWIRDAFHAQ